MDRARNDPEEARVIRVMVVDDIADTRTALAAMLSYEDDIDVVATAADGIDALAAMQAEAADVVLMDVRMPRMDGIEATSKLLAEHPAVKVLVLTTFDEDDYAFAALEAGASGFLLKDTRPAELADAVRAVDRGDAVLSPRITREVIGRLRGDGARSQPQQTPRSREALRQLDALSAREREIAELVADGLTNAEIAERLVLSPETAKTYVKRVIGKLGVRDRVHVVLLVQESRS